jgi:hypothetical protein
LKKKGNDEFLPLRFFKMAHITNSYYKDETMSINTTNTEMEKKFVCEICKNARTTTDPYIILGCQHIYHIVCLAEYQFDENSNVKPIIDGDYCNSRKCPTCENNLCLEDLLFLHTKFLSNTKQNIDQHQKSIDSLEVQMQKLKDELNICYKYKGKLENQRERAKVIVSNITALL